MDYQSAFNRLMNDCTELALATTANGHPNVRIVNFYYDADTKIMYFASFHDNQKVTECLQNAEVAFTLLPKNSEEHIRVRLGKVKQSALSAADVKDKFLAKMPDYLMNRPEVLPSRVILEITFEEADVLFDS